MHPFFPNLVHNSNLAESASWLPGGRFPGGLLKQALGDTPEVAALSLHRVARSQHGTRRRRSERLEDR